MKKYQLGLIMLAVMLFSGCAANPSTEIRKPVSVETMTLKVEKTNTSIAYMGIVSSSSVKKYALKSSGKIRSVHVEVGQAVREGDLLLELDTSDLKFQVDAAKSQADAAYAQYEKARLGAQSEDINNAKLNMEKAQASYDYAQKSFNDAKVLYEAEAISLNSFKEAELNLNIVSKELEQAKALYQKALGGTRPEDVASAKSQYELAKTNYEAIKKLYHDAAILSDIDGYVTDILYEAGELVPSGYPAVLVQSKNQIISIGATQGDMDQISVGMDAEVSINHAVYKGKIINIAQAPDETSRTFNVDIALLDESRKFYIGSMGKVMIITGSAERIYVEIPYLLNDGVDFVYVVEENKAVRKNITISEINNDRAAVTGLYDGAILITKGEKQVKDGYDVEIINQSR